jgi:hypothetical protein
MDDREEDINYYGAWDFITALILCFTVSLLVMGFIVWSPDMSTWHWVCRCLVVAATLCGIAIDYTSKVEDYENEKSYKKWNET